VANAKSNVSQLLPSLLRNDTSLGEGGFYHAHGVHGIRRRRYVIAAQRRMSSQRSCAWNHGYAVHGIIAQAMHPRHAKIAANCKKSVNNPLFLKFSTLLSCFNIYFML
jgi:hypothetical protein